MVANGVIPANESVKKSATRLKSGRSVVPAQAGTHIRACSSLTNGIPAFAGMTLRSLTKGCNFDFFTRSNAGIHARKTLPLYVVTIGPRLRGDGAAVQLNPAIDCERIEN